MPRPYSGDLDALYQMPIEVLDLSEAIIRTVGLVGITTVGDCVDFFMRGSDAMIQVPFGVIPAMLDEVKPRLEERGYWPIDPSAYRSETQVVQVNPNHPDPDAISLAVNWLVTGGLVAFPTETVYGLGANATDADAVSRIFAAKGRPASDPLIVHIADLSQLEQVAVEIPGLARRLAEKFWPGPLTLVLRRGAAIPPNVSAGRDTVAVRMPRHPVALALIRAAGVPVAAPSANLFSRPSPTTAQHVLDDLRGKVDMVLDGGSTDIGLESTVLDLTQTPPVVLRPGGVSLEALREMIPDVQHTPRFVDTEDGAASPGMLLKHYSPQAEVRLFVGPREQALAAMQETAWQLSKDGQQVGILAPYEEYAWFVGLAVEVFSLGSIHDLAEIARNLFAGMRSLDSQGVNTILVRSLGEEGLGLAIHDRLLRAAAGRVVKVDPDGSDKDA